MSSSNQENKPQYVGTGTQKGDNKIEILLYPDQIKDAIRESAKGKKICVLILTKRKEKGTYGETHSLIIKTQPTNESV